MRGANKLLMLLLTKVILFDCEKCKRYWSYEDYQKHVIQGKCKNDPTATNYVSQLNLGQPISSLPTSNV